MNDEDQQQYINAQLIKVLTDTECFYKPRAVHLKFWINGELPVINIELEDESRGAPLHCSGHALSDDR
eukprot:scaffold223422_cov66-Cyclotella_meneghiniana.AAC.1